VHSTSQNDTRGHTHQKTKGGTATESSPVVWHRKTGVKLFRVSQGGVWEGNEASEMVSLGGIMWHVQEIVVGTYVSRPQRTRGSLRSPQLQKPTTPSQQSNLLAAQRCP